METGKRSFLGLNGNQLKILALIAMTIDHIGYYLYPGQEWMRIVGRLAFPIFAYMIAEGARYTKNRKKYLGMMFGLGLICQIVYFFAMASLFQCILITFTLSIILIYALDYAMERKEAEGWILLALLFIAVLFLVYILPNLLKHTDYEVDYGIWGVLFPVFVYLGGKNRWARLAWMMIPLIFMAVLDADQQYAFFALVPLALYNGTRGKWKMKYLFYIYYPLHLVVIYAIGFLM